jgi:hypothetical protein
VLVVENLLQVRATKLLKARKNLRNVQKVLYLVSRPVNVYQKAHNK